MENQAEWSLARELRLLQPPLLPLLPVPLAATSPDARSLRILHQTADCRPWIAALMHNHNVMWREARTTATSARHLLQGACVSYPAAQALRPSYHPPGACPLLPALSLTCRCFFSGLSGLGGRSKQETSQPPPGVPPSSCSCACGADQRCEPRALAAARKRVALAAATLLALT